MFQDKSVQEDVIRELDWEPMLHATEIGVGVKNGIVTLSGPVESHPAKRAAERAAARVHGVRAVSNQLEVKLADTGGRSDADVAWAISNVLAWNAVIPVDQISVSVSHGWVTLEGAVERQFQRRAAEDAIWSLAGVVGISNLIRLQPSVPAEELKQEIESAIGRCAALDPRRIIVEMDGDCVRLWGCVDTLAQREAAEEAAWSAPGIRDISNHITIEVPDASTAAVEAR
jgi:osmotically-inducible protein OsmY